MSPFTEIIIKKLSKHVSVERILFLYHPVDLRDKLKLTSKYNQFPRDIYRSDYPSIVSDGMILVNYEE